VGDGGAYRTKEELQYWMDHKDPIALLGKHLLKTRAATQQKLDALQEQVEQEMLAAIEFAKNAPLPPPEQAYEDLYA
jgi:pyruvate dehydrogenase E1 component alpha subunit